MRALRGDCDLQSRTIRCGRRCICAVAAHRPRGMDMVHGISWLDVPAYCWITPGAEAGKGQAVFYSVPPCGLENVQDALPYRETVYHIAVLQTHTGMAKREWLLMEFCSMTRPLPLLTTVRNTRSRWWYISIQAKKSNVREAAKQIGQPWE